MTDSDSVTAIVQSWLGALDVATCLRWRERLEPTTVRGDFAMTPIDAEHLALLPVVKAWLRGQAPYGAYLLSYGAGEYKAEHTDSGQPHDRVIALLRPADEGGQLYVNGSYCPLAAPGDAVFFPAHVYSHAVAFVKRGVRIVLTVGRPISPASPR